jgi:hypothetical protein
MVLPTTEHAPVEFRHPRTRRPLAATVAALAAVAWASVALGAPASAEEAPVSAGPHQRPVLEKFGWWNKAQQLPPESGDVPPPPGAPENGIYIAHDGSPGEVGLVASSAGGPAAIGAVRFTVPEGAHALLTLQVEKGTAEGATISACPTTGRWAPAQNGRWDVKPGYDCKAAASARASSPQTVVFELTPALQASTGVFDLALVPTGSMPFEVGFQAPSDASLVVTLAADTRPGTKQVVDLAPLDDPGAARRPIPRGQSFTAAPLASRDTQVEEPVRSPVFPDLPAEPVQTPDVLSGESAAAVEEPGGGNANGVMLVVFGGLLLAVSVVLLWVARSARPSHRPGSAA